MTLANAIKVLDDKIKANQAEYNLDREKVKIPALSSGESKKHEYFTEEHLWHKPAQAEFEYFPLGKVFNKRLG